MINSEHWARFSELTSLITLPNDVIPYHVFAYMQGLLTSMLELFGSQSL